MKHEFLNTVRKESSPLHYSVDRYRDGVTFRIYEIGDAVMLDSLKAHKQKSGKGSEFMRWFTQAADRHHTTLRLQAVPSFNNSGRTPEEDQKKLEEWYGRFGFVKGHLFDMSRAPQTPENN